MSMLDSFLNKGFKGSKCKTLLKLTIPRIKLLRNRREIQVKHIRRDIAKLLEAGQEATGRIRVEHIIREENMMAAQEIIELFCELISVRLPIIESQRECPLDLKEAISSICFAAPRCAELPELRQVQLAFVSKYGNEFVAAASELMPNCGVNRQLVELLSVRAPSAEKKLKLLKEIAEEHEVDWDPTPSEAELFKSHEDLLNGPTQFVCGYEVPLPKVNDEILQSTSVQAAGEHFESDEDFDELEFPDVPKIPLKPSAGAEMASPQPSASHPDVKSEDTLFNQSTLDSENTLRAPQHEATKSSSIPGVSKQFVPFIVQGLSHTSPQIEHPSPSSLESTKSLVNPGTSKQFVPFILPGPPSDLRSLSPLRTETDMNVDLKDILAAAKVAAESAERAASAARTAASLAELRISELCKTRSGQEMENIMSDKSVENPFHGSSNSNLSTEMEKLQVDDNPSGDDDVLNPWTQINQTENGSKVTLGATHLETSPSADDPFKREFPNQQPQRIPSMEDESEYSYPNLFSSQGGNMPSVYPSYDYSPSRHGSDTK